MQPRGGYKIDSPDAILIDDDMLVHLCWKMSAEKTDMNFLGFSTVEAFFNKAHALDRGIPIYIDSQLGKNDQGEAVRGEDVSQQIAALGFTRIYLATGLDSVDISQMPWLAGVRGKEPPF